MLQNERKGRSTKIVMAAFDLLFLTGATCEVHERKTVLKEIIADTDVQFSASVEVEAAECTSAHARSVWKASSRRFATADKDPGRGNDWVKKTYAQRETLAIAGYALDETKFDGI